MGVVGLVGVAVVVLFGLDDRGREGERGDECGGEHGRFELLNERGVVA